MFPIQLILTTLLALSSLGLSSAHPASTQAPAASTTGSPSSFNSIQSLFRGNERFRGTNSRKREAVAQLTNEAPSFMFLGCTDNRLTPSSIFQAPIGAIISQNNIGNQYSKKDTSTDAAVTYAIQELGVQHIIVLGHYGCSGIKKAIVQPKEKNSVTKWIQPITDYYRISRRRDIVKFRDSRLPQRGHPEGLKTVPDVSDAGFRAVVEENVRRTVKALKNDSILAKEYQQNAKTRTANTSVEVYVHGFVFDEETGEVVNLNVSFGPPGKPIPSIPFTAVAAAKNFHRDKHLPGINRGKNV